MAALRQPRGIAVALRDPLPWEAFAGAARLAEDLGYTGVFLPEIGGRDAFAALTGLAGETDRVVLGTGVVPMTSRSPRLTAMGAATVQERSGGRAILGIGTGPAVPGALEALRAQVRQLRALVGAAGRTEDGPSLPLPAPVPVWVAALGPRALSLAGAEADGALLNWCPPERVRAARDAVEAGASAGDRTPAELTLAVYVRANLGGDDVAGRAALRVAAGEYASYPAYARQFASVGLEAEAHAAAAAHRAGRPEDVPEALVAAVAVTGDRDAGMTRLQAYLDAGADLVVVYPVVAGTDPRSSLEGTIRALAPG